MKMSKAKRLKFVWIVEHISPEGPSYDYCELDTQSYGMAGASDIETIASSIAHSFGQRFKENITYKPPKGIDKSGTERGLTPKRYHRLSVLEHDRFEKAVLEELKDKR